MATKISAPAVSRYLASKGIVVTPSAADLSMGGVRVRRSVLNEVLVYVTLATGLTRQEEALAAVVADVLTEGGFEVRVNSACASMVYVSKGA